MESMKKAILKKALIKVFKLEESVVVTYMEHIAPISSRASLNAKAIKEVQDIIRLMIKNSDHHRNTCQNLLSKMDMDNRDDY
jgi:hypothetical protein